MNFPTIGYFKAIHNSRGLTTVKDAKVVETRARFAADFDTSINVVHGALRNGLPQDFIIVPTKTGCNLFARPGETFNIGDIIYYNTLHWLVTDVNFHDDLTRSGEMVRCNRQIRWQNKRTGRIVERWCLATKPYASNVNEGLSISNSNREYKIQLSYDEETIQVDLDRRFLLEVIDGEPKAYQITSVDTLTNRYQDVDGGFLIWNMKQSEYNPLTDSAEMMIADYFAPGKEPTPSPADGLSCVISGRDTIRVGMKRTYTVTFYDATGKLTVDGIPAVWDVVAPDGTVDIVDDGYSVTITMVGDIPAGERIQITVRDADGRYIPASFYVEVIDLL